MLADVIPKIAAEMQEDDHPYRARPSLAGPERCIRALVYHAAGVPKQPFPGRALLIFDDSSWHEELTADWIRKSSYQLHSQQMEVDTPVGKGKIDGVLTDLLGVDRLLEHKAINHFTFERIWKGVWPVDYFVQCCLYLVGLQHVNPDMTECLLLIKNKNTAQYLELLMRYDSIQDALTIVEVVRSDGERYTPQQSTWTGLVTESVKKFAQVEAHKTAGTRPDRPFEYGTEFPCGYCRWGKTCWAGYEQEVEALESDVALDQEAEQLCAYYLETTLHLTEMEKEKDSLKLKIKQLLLEKRAKGGRVGPYIVNLSLRKKSRLDEHLIPPQVLEQARIETAFEVLTIRKSKEASNGNGTKS